MADSHIKSNRYTLLEDEIIKNNYPKGGWVKVNEYLPNRDRGSIQNRAKKLKVKYLSYDKNYFDFIDSEEKAYWLGFIYADGYTTRDGRFGIELNSIDHSHLEKLANCMKSNINIRKRIRNDFESSTILIKNRHLVDNLINKGVIPNKTETLSFPSFEVVPENLMRHFVRGFFDGDGTYVFDRKNRIRKDRSNKITERLTKEISVVCKSYNFINGMKNYLEFILNEELKIYESNNLYLIRLSNSKCILNFIEKIQKDSNIFLERKKEKVGLMLDYLLSLEKGRERLERN